MDVHGSMATHSPQPSRLSVDTGRAPFSFQTNSNEPLSPTARLCQDVHILMVIGLAAPIDIADLRAGLEATLVRHPRFSSTRVMTPYPRWVQQKAVNLDDHVIVPGLDSTVASVNSDQLLEDYLASLSTLPMDNSRPLWEVHVLDFPTSEAAASLVFRIHHAIGDGMSLISLFVACARSESDDLKPKTLQPSKPSRRKRPIGGLPPRAARSSGALAFLSWMLSCVLFAWHSLVDMVCLVAMLVLPGDPPTVFKGLKGVEFRRKRFVSRGLSLVDIKHVKNTLNCTINDVLLGVASCALSRYHFRKHGDDASKKGGLCLRFAVAVDMRPDPGIQKLDNLMDPHTHNNAKWGNRVSFMIVPFQIDSHEDPLEYVRQAKKSADRKKYSLEAIFIQKFGEMAIKLLGIRVAVTLFNHVTSRITAGSSNMIGPREQLELFGNRVVSIAPSVYGHRSAVTIHWQSYMDTIRVVLAVDDEQFPDSHQLLHDFSEALKTFRDSCVMKCIV